MLMNGPTRRRQWWNNGGIIILIGAVIFVAIMSLIMCQVVPR